MNGAEPVTRDKPMLPPWLKPHPDALVGVSASRLAYWMPLVHLFWLFWLVGSPWYLPLDVRQRILTALSLAVFLLLYFRAWYGDRRRALWHALAIAALGLALMPGNPAAWVYVIYAQALLPFCLTSVRAIRLGVALLLAMLLDAVALSGFPLIDTISAVAVSGLVFGLNLFAALERRRQAELRLSHAEIRRLAASAERERIGRDLHDLLGHTLSLIAIKSELARRLCERDPALARDELTEIERVARQSLAEVRAAVSGMRAPALASELTAARLMLESAGIQFEYQSQLPEMLPAIESAFAWALREAITNVRRHAGASRVEFTCQRHHETVELIVRDNGRGGVRAIGNGLAGMRERIGEIGGRVEIDSPSGGGTVLRVTVPCRQLHAVNSSTAGEAASPVP